MGVGRGWETDGPHDDVGHWFPGICGKAPETDGLRAALVSLVELFRVE